MHVTLSLLTSSVLAILLAGCAAEPSMTVAAA